MHHLSRALATARIEDLHREAAQMHTIRLARRVTHEPHAAAASRVTQVSHSSTVPGKASFAPPSAAPVSQSREAQTNF
jgi:hypothetical protein